MPPSAALDRSGFWLPKFQEDDWFRLTPNSRPRLTSDCLSHTPAALCNNATKYAHAARDSGYIDDDSFLYRASNNRRVDWPTMKPR